MMSRTLALGLVSTACVVAAGGGSYLAVRQNTVEVNPAPVVQAAPPSAVQETEAVVAPVEKAPPAAPTPERVERPAPPVERKPVERRRPRPRPVPQPSQPVAAEPAPIRATTEPVSQAAEGAGAPAPAIPAAELPATPEPVAQPAEPVFDEVVVPATSVIGLEIENTISTERARVEDRVDARVARDVYVDGRVAIPAGSRVIGAVSLIERGGKVKERARLGIRFHTLVLAGGRQVDLRTEPIYRDGESPVNDSSKKIGGAAVGGAVLGAILGGGKGAIAGATVGAAGGTAAVMAGDRKPATLMGGSVVTVKLAAPVTLDVER